MVESKRRPANEVSILPSEYDMTSEVDDSEEEFDPKGMEEYKLICYFVNDCFKDNQKAIFEQHDDSTKGHLKPLFIQAKVRFVLTKCWSTVVMLSI